MFSIILLTGLTCRNKESTPQAEKSLKTVMVVEPLLFVTALVVGILGATQVVPEISLGASYALIGIGGLDFLIWAAAIGIGISQSEESEAP